MTNFNYANADEARRAFEGKMLADFDVLGYKMYSKSNNTMMRPTGNNWVIALARNSTTGLYHFYRMDANGTWSHKPGTGAAQQFDFSYNPITDPQYANRGDYDEFLGYYEIGLR